MAVAHNSASVAAAAQISRLSIPVLPWRDIKAGANPGKRRRLAALMQLWADDTRAKLALQLRIRSGREWPMRTGAEYLRSLNDGRRVFVDGESVKDVAAHSAFRQAARSVANLFDIAADPALRERMTFASPKTGAPVWRAWQNPCSHADLRARRLFSETWAEATFGLMGRSPDHVAGFFTGYAATPQVFA